MAVQILYDLGGGEWEFLELDATLQAVETLQSTVTEHPVESGGVISDHVVRRPKMLRLEGIISDTPLGHSNYALAALASAGSLLPYGSLIESVVVGGLSAGADYTASARAKDILRTIRSRGEPVTVVDGAGRGLSGGAEEVHESMVFESLEFPRDGTTGDAIRVSASLKEVVTVSSEVVALAKSETPGSVARGKQAPKKADAPLEDSASLMHKMIYGSDP